jgi:hypothetical protein
VDLYGIDPTYGEDAPELLADYGVTVLDDGDAVEVSIDCGPVAAAHVARIPLREWEAAYIRARSLQLDMNGRDF